MKYTFICIFCNFIFIQNVKVYFFFIEQFIQRYLININSSRNIFTAVFLPLAFLN